MTRRSVPARVFHRLSREDGSAVIIALMAMLLLTALGLTLVLTTSTETMIAANYSSGQEALYAAEAILERAMLEVPAAADVDSLLQGTSVSAFRDGAPGSRSLPNGTQLDLIGLTNLANCGRTASCSDDQMNAVSTDRPWGANNPRWQLYAYGPVTSLLPAGQINSPYYAVVWVGDDPAETDADPTHDDATGTNAASRGVLLMRAEAFGPFGSHRRLEVAVQRPLPLSPDTGYTAQRGQDEQNRRYRSGVIPTPGSRLTRTHLNPITGQSTVQ